MITHLQTFWTLFAALNDKRRSEEGASAVEYGLMVAAIAAVVVGVVFAIGTTVKGSFTSTNNCITSKGGAGC